MTNRRIAWAAGGLLAGVTIAVASLPSAAAAQPSPQAPRAAAAVQGTSCGPCTVQMDQGATLGVNIVGDTGPQNGQIVQVTDGFGQPIWAVNKAGGQGTFGDRDCVFGNNNVFVPQVCILPTEQWPGDGTPCQPDQHLQMIVGNGRVDVCANDAKSPTGDSWIRKI